MVRRVDLWRLQREADRLGRACVVDGLIRDAAGRIFVMRRGADRPRFPGAWDLPGGHVEPGESLEDALAREVHEETGWSVRRILDLVAIVDWT